MSEDEPTLTLESIEQYRMRPDRSHEPFATMIRIMQETGFHTWGFVIYRGISDDAAWQRYMALMKDQILQSLVYKGYNPAQDDRSHDKLLPQYLKYTIIEDPAIYGALTTKDDIRELFKEWIAHRSVERDGAGADHPWLTLHYLVPRFSHCIYVDEKSLKTLER